MPASIISCIAIGAVVGVVVGSFLATLAIRWEHGHSVVRGRSRCDRCEAPLPVHALVPIVSAIVLRGRCGRCGGQIDRRHGALELGCALIGGGALALAPGAAGWAGALFGWVLAVLAMLDLACLWLPDRLTAPLACAGLAAGTIGIAPALDARLAGALAGYAALAAIGWAYRRLRGFEGLGGGDAKLLGAIGAWLGWRTLPAVVLIAALAGLGWAGWRALRGNPLGRYDRLPFGTLLAGGAWASWIMATLA